MEKKNYMTPVCHKTLTDELTQLLRVERPEVCQLVQWAAANGDRSENADYQYGKRRLREIDRRIRFLTQRLDDAVVVDPASVRSEKVQFGATVTVSTEEGDEKTWSIVGVDEINTELGRVSWQSPIGRALIGKTIGDEAVIQTPQGAQSVEITEIRYKSLS
jgi:transcription elongation factor GreB